MGGSRAKLVVVVIFFLAASSLYLARVIQDGSSPLAILSPRAAGGDSEQLLAQNILTPSPSVSASSPTVPFQSTSPTIAVSTSPSISPTDALPVATSTPEPTIEQPTPTVPVIDQPTPTTQIIYVTATPSVITELPVAGAGNLLKPVMIGAGLLLLLGLGL